MTLEGQPRWGGGLGDGPGCARRDRDTDQYCESPCSHVASVSALRFHLARARQSTIRARPQDVVEDSHWPGFALSCISIPLVEADVVTSAWRHSPVGAWRATSIRGGSGGASDFVAVTSRGRDRGGPGGRAGGRE